STTWRRRASSPNASSASASGRSSSTALPRTSTRPPSTASTRARPAPATRTTGHLSGDATRCRPPATWWRTGPDVSVTLPQQDRRWRKPPAIANPYARYALFAAAAAYLVWAVASLELSWARIMTGIPRAIQIFSRAFPPDFSRRGLMIDGFVESIQIALVATLLGVILSLVLGILAARNVVPRAVYLVGRAIISIARSFHPVIVAIIFVKAVGFGPFAGILTLVIYSIGFVGKLMA